MTRRLRVMVLMGGRSSEREVSLVSGGEVLKNLNKSRYEAWGVDVPSELIKLGEIKPDVAFIAMHGKGGEDGVIQGYLETLGIKYTGCGVLASALGMDKLLFRKVMESLGIPMPKLVTGAPCVVKPADQGSSVGVSIVKKNKDLAKAIALAKKFSDRVIMEEYIKGIEVSCAVIGNEEAVALPIVEIRPKKEFFDYEAKYTGGMCEEVCPAEIPANAAKLVSDYAVRVFKGIGGRGFARVDMIIRDNLPYVLEINTIPGLTPNSLLPKEAKAAGLSYPELLDKIIKLAQQ